MSARDIIAALCYKPISLNTVPLGRPAAELIIESLTASGYRLLAPGELDGETLEVAAKVAEQEGVYPELNVGQRIPDWYKHGRRIAAAIRALKEH